MEEDNIAVLLYILKTFRIRLDRRPPRVWARILDTQTRPILRSPFIDKRIVFRGPNREQTTLFQPFLLLTLVLFAPLTLLQVKTVMNGTCVTLLLFFLERH